MQLAGVSMLLTRSVGDENRLRDNELKRLLMSSERELETCKQELTQAIGNHADIADARHKPEPG